MTMIYLAYILLTLITLLLIILMIKYWNEPIGIGESILESLTAEQLGYLEGKIKDLKEVIVIADNIEEPTSKLYNAVKINLERNVKYTFLISKKNYSNQLDSYYSIFRAIAKSKNLDHLVEIKSLDLFWNEFPCIFYRISSEIEDYYLAYLGNEKKEGIAEAYDFISPRMANIFIKLT